MGFRENLKSELAFSGMLVKELAAKSGVNKYSIDNYLNARGQIPSVEAGVAIARALGVSVECLVTGKDSRKKSVSYPIEARVAAEIITQMNKKNRKMTVAIIKSIKKQEEEEQESENLS